MTPTGRLTPALFLSLVSLPVPRNTTQHNRWSKASLKFKISRVREREAGEVKKMDDYTREMMDLKTLVTRTLEKKGVLAKIRVTISSYLSLIYPLFFFHFFYCILSHDFWYGSSMNFVCSWFWTENGAILLR